MYHVPALLPEALALLATVPQRIVVDATFGGGGHTRAWLQQLPSDAQLFAFDQDPDAFDVYDTDETLKSDQRLRFIPQNFRTIRSALQDSGVLAGSVNAILADLGISSHQIDVPERGFSYRFDAPLDMRMNPDQILTAEHVLNSYPVDELANIFKYYGELSRSTVMAKEIVARRPIATTFQLNKALEAFKPRFDERQFWSKIYQAIRIEVNDELNALKDFLEQSLAMLDIDGILVIITYHSLEDRLVKHFLATGNFEGIIQTDFYGNKISPFRHPIPKDIIPSDEEIKTNPRIRSARMRHNYKVKLNHEHQR
jgi:16S rRNA (cytosine1402-N4)-methyltransferase